ncbi:MAG: metallophosphoesterase [Paramuribaculum sp.]|nr:metallophosphoesterase [Paramuribaculum sp.]
MRIPFLMLTIVLLLNVAVDRYIWKFLRSRFRSTVPSAVHLIISGILYIFLAIALCIPRRDGTDEQLLTVMWMLFGYFSVYIPKYLFVIFDLLSRIPCLFRRRPLKWMSRCGAVVGVLLFLAMWWGALINRYNVQVVEETVWIPELPEAFDGYRILQFSDAHVGTYGSDTTYISKVVDRINDIDVDLVAFTGDIVNRRSEELKPHVRPLSRIKGRDGVVSILGNHDYGDYSDWPSDEAKMENRRLLHSFQRQMGWHLMLNDHIYLVRGRDSIAVIGVENVGDPPFTVYGDLKKSYPTLGDSLTKVLLSHNPAHWVDDIKNNDSLNIPLTLSGHTHAMQIEVLGISPAWFRYRTWGGMYSDKDASHRLYVNIGLGTVGIPMRLGATPELTVLTLRRGSSPE